MIKNNYLRTIQLVLEFLLFIAKSGWWPIDPSFLACLILIVVLFRVSNRCKRWLSRF